MQYLYGWDLSYYQLPGVCCLLQMVTCPPPLTAAEVVPDFNQASPRSIHRPTGIWDDPHLRIFRHQRTSKVDPTANILVVEPAYSYDPIALDPKSVSIPGLVRPDAIATTTGISQAELTTPQHEFGPGKDPLPSIYPQWIGRKTDDTTVQWTSPPNSTVEYPTPIETQTRAQVQWSDGGNTVD